MADARYRRGPAAWALPARNPAPGELRLLSRPVDTCPCGRRVPEQTPRFPCVGSLPRNPQQCRGRGLNVADPAGLVTARLRAQGHEPARGPFQTADAPKCEGRACDGPRAGPQFPVRPGPGGGGARLPHFRGHHRPCTGAAPRLPVSLREAARRRVLPDPQRRPRPQAAGAPWLGGVAASPGCGRPVAGWGGHRAGQRRLTPFVLTDTQPRKVRKVPPGLPSSVSCGACLRAPRAGVTPLSRRPRGMSAGPWGARAAATRKTWPPECGSASGPWARPPAGPARRPAAAHGLGLTGDQL